MCPDFAASNGFVDGPSSDGCLDFSWFKLLIPQFPIGISIGISIDITMLYRMCYAWLNDPLLVRGHERIRADAANDRAESTQRLLLRVGGVLLCSESVCQFPRV